MASLSAVLFIACAVTVSASIPPNYVLKALERLSKTISRAGTAVVFVVLPDFMSAIGNIFDPAVTHECGSDVKDDARIDILTDLVIEAQATCDGGVEADFETTDDVNFHLMVSYPSHGSQPCVFKKMKHTLVFSVKLRIAYGEKPGLVHMEEERFTVTCSYSPHGMNNSRSQNIIAGLIAPPEFLTMVGPDSKSTFSFHLVNVEGDDLASENVFLGRKVQLRGRTAAEHGEVGLRPVQCFAMDGDQKYAILRGGCGDGIVFPQDYGFETNGTTTLSPYFDAFSINFSPVIKFKCTFVTCKSNCDGSSCESEARKRRDTSDFLWQEPDIKVVRSRTVTFIGAHSHEGYSTLNQR